MPRPAYDRRRRIVVDRELQLRLVTRIAAAFLGSLLFFLAVALGTPLFLGAMTGIPDWGLSSFGMRVRFLFAFVALPLLAALLILFAVGVRSTFGVAGPLYRFCQVFRDLAALRIPRGVRIRKDDHLQDPARLFDGALVALHDHLDELQERARAAADELESQIDADPRLLDSLQGLRAELHALRAGLESVELLPSAPGAAQSAAAATPADARALVP